MTNEQQQQPGTSQGPSKQINIFLCQEKIDRKKSPELFQEAVPGAWDLHKEYTVSVGLKLRTGLNFGNLSGQNKF